MKTKLLETNNTIYLKRLAREINDNNLTCAPYYKCEGQFNGRRIIRARLENGCLIGRSLNGEEWALNPDMIYDGNGNQIVASRQP